MTQEEKDLLFKDICARLPYHVHVKVWLKDGTTEEGPLDLEYNYSDVLKDAFYYNEIVNIKPYLRPMSSITEEEKEEIKPLFSKFTDEFGKRVLVVRQNKIDLYQDWLNKKMFAYRTINDEDMFELGLALVAPEGMYNIKEQ